MLYGATGFLMTDSIKVIEMQKIDRNELAKSAIAGGNCKTTCTPTTTTVVTQQAPAPTPAQPPKVMYNL